MELALLSTVHPLKVTENMVRTGQHDCVAHKLNEASTQVHTACTLPGLLVQEDLMCLCMAPLLERMCLVGSAACSLLQTEFWLHWTSLLEASGIRAFLGVRPVL